MTKQKWRALLGPLAFALMVGTVAATIDPLTSGYPASGAPTSDAGGRRIRARGVGVAMVASSDVLSSRVTPSLGASKFEVECAMTTAQVLYYTVYDGTSTKTCSLNGGTALTANASTTLTFSVNPTYTYNFQTGGGTTLNLFVLTELSGACARASGGGSSSGGGGTLAGDVTGSSGANKVVSLTGNGSGVVYGPTGKDLSVRAASGQTMIVGSNDGNQRTEYYDTGGGGGIDHTAGTGPVRFYALDPSRTVLLDVGSGTSSLTLSATALTSTVPIKGIVAGHDYIESHLTSSLSAAVSGTVYDVTPNVDDESDGITRSGATYTIARAGMYRVNVYGIWDTNATGFRALYLRDGSSNYLRHASQTGLTGTTTAQAVTWDIRCAASATLKLSVQQTSGGALNFSGDASSPTGQSRISIQWVRP